MRLIDDPRLTKYSVADDGCLALVYGESGTGKTLALRSLFENLGSDSGIVIATDPRMAPLDGTNANVLKCWIEPSVSEPAAMKAAAEDAWARLTAFNADLRAAMDNPKVAVPCWIALDNLFHAGEVKHLAMAPAGGKLSIPQWGDFANEMLGLVTFYRGLSKRGMLRIINCTSVWERGEKGALIVDEYGRKIPKILVGTGGKVAPTLLPSKIDLMFFVTAEHRPSDPEAGKDGMVRKFQTCTAEGITAKGHPKLPTPYTPADWWDVLVKLGWAERFKAAVAAKEK